MPSPSLTELPAQAATAQWQIEGATASLSLTGHLNAHTLGGLWRDCQLRQAAWLANTGRQAALTIDLQQVSYLDGAAIAFLIDMQHTQQAAGGTATLVNLDARYQPLIQQYQPFDNLFPKPDGNHHTHTSLVERVGKATFDLAEAAGT